LPPELKEPLVEKARERGVTIQDEFELAVRAWLTVPVPERYIPTTRVAITPYDKMIIRMRRHNGDTYTSIAKDYGVTWQYVRMVARTRR
jgi:hypothetical protein